MASHANDDELTLPERTRQELEQALRQCRQQLLRTEAKLREVTAENSNDPPLLR